MISLRVERQSGEHRSNWYCQQNPIFPWTWDNMSLYLVIRSSGHTSSDSGGPTRVLLFCLIVIWLTLIPGGGSCCRYLAAEFRLCAVVSWLSRSGCYSNCLLSSNVIHTSRPDIESTLLFMCSCTFCIFLRFMPVCALAVVCRVWTSTSYTFFWVAFMAGNCFGSEDTNENSGSNSTEAEEGLGRVWSAWIARSWETSHRKCVLLAFFRHPLKGVGSLFLSFIHIYTDYTVSTFKGILNPMSLPCSPKGYRHSPTSLESRGWNVAHCIIGCNRK